MLSVEGLLDMRGLFSDNISEYIKTILSQGTCAWFLKTYVFKMMNDYTCNKTLMVCLYA